MHYQNKLHALEFTILLCEVRVYFRNFPDTLGHMVTNRADGVATLLGSTYTSKQIFSK
jgi:hypothetical protein